MFVCLNITPIKIHNEIPNTFRAEFIGDVIIIEKDHVMSKNFKVTVYTNQTAITKIYNNCDYSEVAILTNRIL